MFVWPAMSLRDDFIADDEEHRTGGNTEMIGTAGSASHMARSADNSVHRFD